MTDYATLTTAQIEARLVELGFSDDGGRKIEAQKSALRTALRLRSLRAVDPDVEAKIARAVAAVNRVRPADAQITETDMNVIDAQCIARDKGWAALFATAEECEEVDRRRRSGTWHPRFGDGGPEVRHGSPCEVCDAARAEARR